MESHVHKKTLHASEQEREDVQQARREWIEALPTMKVEKLVFIDETWTSINITRRHGRAPSRGSETPALHCQQLDSSDCISRSDSPTSAKRARQSSEQNQIVVALQHLEPALRCSKALAPVR